MIMSMSLPPEIVDEIDRLAINLDVSRSAVLRGLIRASLIAGTQPELAGESGFRTSIRLKRRIAALDEAK